MLIPFSSESYCTDWDADRLIKCRGQVLCKSPLYPQRHMYMAGLCLFKPSVPLQDCVESRSPGGTTRTASKPSISQFQRYQLLIVCPAFPSPSGLPSGPSLGAHLTHEEPQSTQVRPLSEPPSTQEPALSPGLLMPWPTCSVPTERAQLEC